jgi:NTP pyrophosphatase (non-canonical NTP hydrolase)
MKWRIEKMFNLNELCVMAYENAAKREAKDGKVSTDTMQMLKHTVTEVVEATEAYSIKLHSAVDNPELQRARFASELADIVCCVLIIAGKENIDMEYALTACMEKNYKRAIGELI